MGSINKRGLRILITGATGLLGREVFNVFSSETNNTIIGLGYKRAKEPLKKVDLTDDSSVNSFFENNVFDIIIHCAAERDPSICETDFQRTDSVNVDSTSKLIFHANQQSAKLVFLSTDYVFDGSSPPYKENDQRKPLNYYGLSKVKAEDLIQESSNSFLILRVPVLYGPSLSLKESSITQIAQQVIEQKKMSYDHWALRSPTLTTDVALAIHKLVNLTKDKIPEKEVLHFSSTEQLTKYQMAKIITDKLGISTKDFIPLSEPENSTPRPKDCTLDTSEIRKLIEIPHQPFQFHIEKILESLL